MDRLVRLAAEVDDMPTLTQLDEMMAELRGRPKSQANDELMDGLLDLRAALAA